MVSVVLPDELWRLIFMHRAASVIRSYWLRYVLFAHARKPKWEQRRTHLQSVEAWPELLRFSLVRREWRHEPHSWDNSCVEVMRQVRMEAQNGLWGSSVDRL